MYYEEKLINGVWCWRSLPNGQWRTFTDAERRLKMHADVLAMAERARREVRHRDDWIGHRSTVEVGAIFRFGLACRRFAYELEQRG